MDNGIYADPADSRGIGISGSRLPYSAPRGIGDSTEFLSTGSEDAVVVKELATRELEAGFLCICTVWNSYPGAGRILPDRMSARRCSSSC